MNDVRGVGVGERLRNLRSDLEHVGHRHAATRDELIERAPRDQLHHHVGDVSIGPEVVHGDDVWMIERGDGARLLHEADLAIAVRHHLGAQHLQRDVAPQPGIVRPVDGAHAALAQHADQLVGADATSWNECHGDVRRSAKNA